jgi:nicotinamide riboside transporter PnuC
MEWILAPASLLGLLALSQGRRWGWLVATAASLGYVEFCWHQGLAGQALLNLVYALTQLWGWRDQPTFRSHRGAYAWLLPALPLGWLLQSWLTPVDAWLTALALAAQGMTSAKMREVWRCWVVIDLATATLYVSHQAWATAALYCVLAVVAEGAHRTWIQDRSEEGGQACTEKGSPYARQ